MRILAKLTELLSAEEPVGRLLARFNGRPAVFLAGEAPETSDLGWENGGGLPRLELMLRENGRPGRKDAGTVTVRLYYERGSMPAQASILIHDCLTGRIIKPEGGGPTQLLPEWSRTWESGEYGGEEQAFRIMEYVSWKAGEPDPIWALEAFVHKSRPQLLVLPDDFSGDTGAGAFKEGKAACYCRLLETREVTDTNRIVWMEADIGVEIISPETELRFCQARLLADALLQTGELSVPGEAPMRITKLKLCPYNKTGDPEALFVTIRYGLLKYREEAPKLMGVKFTEGNCNDKEE